MNYNKKKRSIHQIEIDIENYHQKNTKKVYSINYFKNIEYHPRLNPLRNDDKPILPDLNRFLNIEDSDNEKEVTEEKENIDVYVPRMLFIPLKSENQISLSQSSSESESIKSNQSNQSYQSNIIHKSKYAMKRKRVRQPLSTLTNQQSLNTSTTTLSKLSEI